MAKKDYYEVLGLDKNADGDAIKRAYRQLAKKYHPDLNPGNAEAEQAFKEVNEAYSVLSDSEKKAKYDQFGHAAFDPGAGSGGYSGGGYSGGFGDFGDFGDILSGFFGGAFGGKTQRPSGPEQGEDIGMRMPLSFEEAVFGCKKDISYKRWCRCSRCNGNGAEAGTSPETCPDCRGKGIRMDAQRMGFFQSYGTCGRCKGTGKIIKNPCQKCGGSGLEQESRNMTVTIPAGFEHGQRLALRDMGNAGRFGGPNGDVIIEVAVQRHRIFERDGVNIFCEVPVNIVEATLGGEIDVPTLEGTVKYKLDEGTQPGDTFTLRGKGIPYLNRSGNPNAPQRRGDLICTVVVEVPRGLSEKQKDALRAFAETCGEKNYSKKGKHKKK